MSESGHTEACHESERFVVCWDSETQQSFKNCPGATREEQIERYMQFSCICCMIVSVEDVLANKSADAIVKRARRVTFWRDKALPGHSPIHGLLTLFDEASLIVGFNNLAFDHLLVKRFYRPLDGLSAMQRYCNHRAKSLDIFARVRDVTGLWLKLDALLMENKLSTKSGDGLKAIKLWENQERDELESYCATDVELTLRLSLLDSMTARGLDLGQSVHSLRYALRAVGARKRKRGDAIEDDDFVIVSSNEAPAESLEPTECEKREDAADQVPVMY